jgi:hypothetical protein
MLRSTHRLDGVPGDPDPEPGDAQGESEERPGVAICYPVGRSAPGPEGSTQPSPCPTASPEQPPATCFSAHGDGEHEGHDPRVAASGQGPPSADRQAACRPCLLGNCLPGFDQGITEGGAKGRPAGCSKRLSGAPGVNPVEAHDPRPSSGQRDLAEENRPLSCATTGRPGAATPGRSARRRSSLLLLLLSGSLCEVDAGARAA